MWFPFALHLVLFDHAETRLKRDVKRFKAAVMFKLIPPTPFTFGNLNSEWVVQVGFFGFEVNNCIRFNFHNDFALIMKGL